MVVAKQEHSLEPCSTTQGVNNICQVPSGWWAAEAGGGAGEELGRGGARAQAGVNTGKEWGHSSGDVSSSGETNKGPGSLLRQQQGGK